MKTYRNIKRVVIVIGIIYGFWLGSHNGCTDTEVTAGLIMIVISAMLGISMVEVQVTGHDDNNV